MAASQAAYGALFPSRTSNRDASRQRPFISNITIRFWTSPSCFELYADLPVGQNLFDFSGDCIDTGLFRRQIACAQIEILSGDSIRFDLSVRHAQNFSFGKSETVFLSSHPASSKRGVRVVTNVEAGCGGRERGGRRLTRARTAKPCGPGAPKQALSSRGFNEPCG